MYCPDCGSELPDSAKVCGYCGHRLQLPLTDNVQLQLDELPAQTASDNPNWKETFRSGMVTFADSLLLAGVCLVILLVVSVLLVVSIIISRWMTFSLFKGSAMAYPVEPIILLPSILSVAGLVFVVVPKLWTWFEERSHFGWLEKAKSLIERVQKTPSLAIAILSIFFAGYILFWISTWITGGLATLLPFVGKFLPFIIDILAFIALGFYIAPWIWKQFKLEDVPLWGKDAQETRDKLLKHLSWIVALIVVTAIIIFAGA